MKKFVLRETGEEVKMGDIITYYNPKDIYPILHLISIDEKSLDTLIKEGVIKVVTDESKQEELSVGAAIIHLANRIKWNPDNVAKYLDNLESIYPIAAFNVILRELAIMLDEKYEDHINNSKEIWIISSLNGNIVKVKDITKIKNFRNFAAFRTLEDAKIAREVMKDIISDLFKRGGK